MKKYYFYLLIMLISIIVLTMLVTYLHTKMLVFNSMADQINNNSQKDNNKEYLQSLDEYCNINIYNVTINKLIAEIGENVTVSTVYSLICNEGYEKGYGKIGICKSGGNLIEYKNSLIDGVEYLNISETLSIDPYDFNAFDICKGRVEFEIFNILDPENPPPKTYANYSKEDLEIRKAKLNYTLIGLDPLTIFSDDIISFNLLIHNEHTKYYIYSNNYIEGFILNKNKSLNFSKWTDSNGFLNFTVNCSLLGSGIYTIQLINNETMDYESTFYSFQVEVLDKSSCINCSLLNGGTIYTNVNYDNSNYSKAFFLIECAFNANISWYSTFGNGILSKIGNQYNTTILSPNVAGIYKIHFIAKPLTKGKQIEFDIDLPVKKRPIELFPTSFRKENLSLLYFLINITDKLNNKLINYNNMIEIFIKYNNTNWKVNPIECNSSGLALFEWPIPNRIVEDYISFEFVFNNSPVYQFSSVIKNLTITNLVYSGPFHMYSTQNLSFLAELVSLNGKKLSNQLINLKINDNSFDLITNNDGEIHYSLIAPSYSTILKLEIYFAGSDNISASILIIDIKIELDLLHQIWKSLGFILMGIGIVMISILYFKKIITKRNLASLQVD